MFQFIPQAPSQKTEGRTAYNHFAVMSISTSTVIEILLMIKVEKYTQLRAF